ncbi:MAG: alkaline phosphatase [Muribaculaceae bacterium]|nr:alkaline phosphatase [Muribaculaceae bacterium]
MNKIKSALLTSILFAVFSNLSAQESPKYIFYFIGDGMGMGHVAATQAYKRMILSDEEPLLMMQFPVAGMLTTHSASSPVTDSAAAGTALATGNKTKNGMLGMDTDSVAVESIAAQLFSEGYGIGLVTSVPPDDATPGAFYAHVPHRSMYYDITVQAAQSGYQFLGGSKLRGTKDKDGNPNDLIDVLKQYNMEYVMGADAARSSTSERILMVNPEGIDTYQIGYTVDSIPGALTLPEMTEVCLSHLQKWCPEKFFMMVEGGNIDYAGHSNDGGTAIKEVLNFDQTLRLAYNFYNEHPEETLIIVTADHDTGGLAIGSIFTGYNMQPQYIDYQKISKDRFNDECRAILKSRRVFTWDDMKEMLKENLGFWAGVPVNEKQTALLEEKFTKTFEMRNSEDQKTLYQNFDEFSTTVFNIFNDICGIGWVTYNHTGNYVPVYAIGVEADKFAGLHDNTNIPEIIREITGLNK